MMIIQNPNKLTTMEIWSPKYSTIHTEGEWVVLLSQRKVFYATGVILVEFTKAKHLKGQRFCITREAAKRYPLVTNGKIKCHEVPFDALEPWETAAEIQATAETIFE